MSILRVRRCRVVQKFYSDTVTPHRSRKGTRRGSGTRQVTQQLTEITAQISPRGVPPHQASPRLEETVAQELYERVWQAAEEEVLPDDKLYR